MRGSKVQGRFTVDHETEALYEGIRDELRDPVGVDLLWYRWDQEYLLENFVEIADSTYDTSNPTPGFGRRWNTPIRIPAITAQLFQGQVIQNERGLYTTDNLRIILNVGDTLQPLPTLTTAPDSYLKDRIVFRNTVFTPTKVYPRGHIGYAFAVVTIDCNQVNPEELVNDPQFQQYASGVPESYDGFGEGSFGSGPYGE